VFHTASEDTDVISMTALLASLQSSVLLLLLGKPCYFCCTFLQLLLQVTIFTVYNKTPPLEAGKSADDVTIY